MPTAKKINNKNHKPGRNNGGYIVYSKQFNELIDVVQDINSAENTLDSSTYNIKNSSDTTVGTLSGTSGTPLLKSVDGTGSTSSYDISIQTGNTESAISGAATFSSGSVSTLGKSGDVNISSGNSDTSGASGDVYVISGDSADAESGNVIIGGGEGASTTVKGMARLTGGTLVVAAEDVEVETGNTITGVELVGGYIDVTGATGTVTLPTAADIKTALSGSVTPGTYFDFVIGTGGMNGSQTLTVAVNTGVTVISTPVITGSGTLTVSQDDQEIAVFRIIFNSTTTCKLSRLV